MKFLQLNTNYKRYNFCIKKLKYLKANTTLIKLMSTKLLHCRKSLKQQINDFQPLSLCLLKRMEQILKSLFWNLAIKIKLRTMFKFFTLKIFLIRFLLNLCITNVFGGTMKFIKYNCNCNWIKLCMMQKVHVCTYTFGEERVMVDSTQSSLLAEIYDKSRRKS